MSQPLPGAGVAPSPLTHPPPADRRAVPSPRPRPDPATRLPLRARVDWPAAAVGLGCVAAAVVAAAGFLPHQSVWVDEATQLSGLALDPVHVTRWLAGREAHDEFGVPADRMPPLSYWVGWVWSQAFGRTETALRWLGVALTAAATLLVFLTARRAWGLPAAAAAALVFGVSPNVAVQAVEIRSYPLFLLTSAAVWYCLVRILVDDDGDRPGRLAALVAAGAAAMFTHFFGLVLVGGALLTVLVAAWRRGRSVVPVLAAIAVTGVAAFGLSPFVVASGRLTSPGGEGDAGTVLALARLAYRLFAHPSTGVSHLAVGACAVGAVLAAAAAIVGQRRSLASPGLGLAMASGLAVVAVASFVLTGFNAARPSYNVWVLPGLALWLAAGVASPVRWARRAARVGVALLVAANVYAVSQLAGHGALFAHTPHRELAEVVRRLGPDGVTVVYEDAPGLPQAGHLYFPLWYEFGPAVPHYNFASAGPGGVRVALFPEEEVEADLASLRCRHLVVMRGRRSLAVEVAQQVRDGVRPVGDGEVARALERSGRWVRVEDRVFGAFVTVDVAVFRAADR